MKSYLRSFAINLFRYLFPIKSMQRLEERCKKKNPIADLRKYRSFNGKSEYKLGIIREFTCFHHYYISACREMNVSYKVLDIIQSDWINVINRSDCDAFLVWPTAINTCLHRMYNDKLEVLEKDLNKLISPSFKELWMWESKIRMREFMNAHQIPCPETWVFYKYEDVKLFIESAVFPMIYKPNFGDCSNGIRILNNKVETMRLAKKIFSKGIRISGSHRCDYQWGNMLLQKYIPNAKEWRIIRIGKSYFGYVKQKHGDFASGYGDVVYESIPERLLEFMRSLTNKHCFESMSIDILVDQKTKNFFVIELQSLFGDTKTHSKLEVDGKTGRYIYDSIKDIWLFEEGGFGKNNCCNLRIENVLNKLENRGEYNNARNALDYRFPK